MKIATIVVAMAIAALTGRAEAGEQAIGLYELNSGSGYDPESGVIVDHGGNIFGETVIGGNGPCVGYAGCGTVYELSPPSERGNPWTISVLYNFQGGQDGGSFFGA